MNEKENGEHEPQVTISINVESCSGGPQQFFHNAGHSGCLWLCYQWLFGTWPNDLFDLYLEDLKLGLITDDLVIYDESSFVKEKSGMSFYKERLRSLKDGPYKAIVCFEKKYDSETFYHFCVASVVKNKDAIYCDVLYDPWGNHFKKAGNSLIKTGTIISIRYLTDPHKHD